VLQRAGRAGHRVARFRTEPAALERDQVAKPLVLVKRADSALGLPWFRTFSARCLDRELIGHVTGSPAQLL
jgi:Lhr-like helicase